MSYFPCDIPYMSEEELEENGIKIPKDDKFETYWNTVEKATELADKLKMEIAEANEWDTALAIVDEELRPILAGLQLIDMKDEARKARLKELAEEDWIPVNKDMPVEHDSVFTRFHGTDKWRDGMWLKSSAKVLVTVEFEDGTRLTETAKTIDGKWATENRIRKRKVIAWKKMPKEYKGK